MAQLLELEQTTSMIDLNTEVFLKGRYRGDAVDDVNDEDPDYLRNLLAREDPVMTHQEAEIVRRVVGIGY